MTQVRTKEALTVGQYMLARDKTETERLNIQHDCWVQNIGYLVHPRIVASLPSNSARVAEVATGSGIWLADARKILPADTEYVGFDISEDQFPNDTAKDPNHKFVVHNCFEPFGDEWLGKFDMVHVRLLASLMGPGDWELLAQNLITLLKPGGYIQWSESNFHEFFRAPYRQSSIPLSMPTMEDSFLFKILYLMRDFFNTPELKGTRDIAGSLELPDIYRRLGLDSVSLDVVSANRLPELRRNFTWSVLGAIHGILRSMAKRPNTGFTAQEMEDWVDAAYKEIEEGVYIESALRTNIGRRPQ